MKDFPGDGTRAFLLSPIAQVPDPETYAMLLAGIAQFSIATQKAKHLIKFDHLLDNSTSGCT
ncbi:hypothetical protein [Nitrosomonas sp. Is79A3]|uniref:hypothetical protein n=1 Tax=Nitrosomonas sp. (strain Is79A3) TaxID=261292 RepID=UPI0002EB698C